LDDRPVYNQQELEAVAEMGDCARAIKVGRKVGAAVPLSAGELGPHLTQCRHNGQFVTSDNLF